jgi:serine phosphatase RsbU (regulator of sigma subunit)
VVGAVADVAGAARAALVTLTPDRRVLELVDQVGFTEAQLSASRLALDDGHPVAEAAQTRTPVTLHGPASRSRYPLATGAVTDPLQMVLPLVAHDAVVGVLALSWSDRGELSAAESVLVHTVALQVGQALDRARLYDTSVETARLLQSTLLPTQIPPTPGLQIAARYQPVEEGSVVGGDFYDVFRRGDGRSFGVSIGDVSGKGVRAASLTALARHTIRAASRRATSAAAVLEELNDAILADDNADRYLTVAHLIVQPDNMATKVTLALGGHPQPFLRSADRSVRAIGHPGTAVGLLDRGQWADEQVTLATGNVLVLFTDGLTDVRHRVTGELAGDLVADVLRASDATDAESLADELIGTVVDFAGGARRDDMALLVLLPTG